MKIGRRSFLGSIVGAAALPALQASVHASPGSDAVSPAELAADPRRPQYHLLPAKNWMNDPNGPIYWNGKYHMFYQYNPDGAVWGNMHWGHAVSEDMVHWRHLPVALAPTAGSADAEGCFTGTAAVVDGHVAILYTGVRASSLEEATIKDGHPPLRESQCLAFAGDAELTVWTKDAAPVIAAPPTGLQVNGFRDPSPWKQSDLWYLVTACGLPNQGGAVLLYRSRDLRSWEYMHILARRDRTGEAGFDSFDPWEVWECAEFFAIGDWHVLMFSTAGKVYWQSGKLDKETMIFHRVQAGIMDYGSYYAAKTQLDKAGNRILWGWITEARPLDEYKAAGWAGVMSLPRTLSVAEDGRLRIGVADAVNTLRAHEQKLNPGANEESIQQQIGQMRIEECCGEILCKLRENAGPFELVLFGQDERAAWVTIDYNHSHSKQVAIDGRPLPGSLDLHGGLELHVYVDGSVLEIFVNGQIAWTKRFYPAGKEAQSLRMKCGGGAAGIQRLSVWQLSPITSDRLTS
jgi:beta-fructofuranosidase